MATSGGAPQEILRGSSPVWDPSGKRIYYATQERLGGTGIQSVEFDESSERILGAPHNLGVMTGILRDLSMSRSGPDRRVRKTRIAQLDSIAFGC